MLKAIPPLSNYPFDPDNPVPKGQTLSPAELRAKYNKTIDPNAKFYVGDPRLQRDRSRQVDPRRTVLYKKIRADPQEIFEASRRYMVDEICRGRWYDNTYKNEVLKPVDTSMRSKSRYKNDHDMFSILANKYGNEFKGWELPPKIDFVSKNRRLAGIKALTTESKSVDSVSREHWKAIRQAQSLKKTIANSVENTSLALSMELTTQRKEASDRQRPHREAELQADEADAVGEDMDRVQNAIKSQGNRPSTSDFVNTLPMPPLPGEVIPAERRKPGVYPLHWQPRPKVLELRNRLCEVLKRKHTQLKNSFRRFDEDHRGTVDLYELYRVLVEESGIQCTRQELEELWDFFDRDRDGLVQYSDYAKTMGDDALDERDYFQIAHRKAAGKYNEEVRFFPNEDEQENAHFMNKAKPGILANDESSIERQLFYEKIEAQPRNSMFTLRNKKIGARFNEVLRKPLGTVEGTNTHRLRLLLAEKLNKLYGDASAAVQKYETNDRGYINLFQFSRMVKDLGIEASDMLVNMLFQAFDGNYDGLLSIEDLTICCHIDPTAGATMKSTIAGTKDVLFDDVKKLKPKITSIGLRQNMSKSNLEIARSMEVSEDTRPMSALSSSGGFQPSLTKFGSNIHQRASTPLQQVREEPKVNSLKVTDLLGLRPASTPPIMQHPSSSQLPYKDDASFKNKAGFGIVPRMAPLPDKLDSKIPTISG